jgi:hypothetical protein
VTLTSPTQGSSLMAPANVILNAVTGGSPVVTKVEFYNGTTLLGTDVSAPYSFAWNPVDSGTYTVSAKVHTKSGLTATSTPVTFKSGESKLEGLFREVFVGTTGAASTVKEIDIQQTRVVVPGIGPGLVGKADAFQFVYFPILKYDVEFHSVIKSMSLTRANAMAGLMVRESMAPGSRCLFIGRNGLGEVILIKRTALNGAVTTTKLASTKTPAGFNIYRKGNDWVVYRADDGIGRTWTYVTTVAMAFANGAYPGMAVISGSTTEENTVVFENPGFLELGPGTRGVNFPPEVSIALPVSGSSFKAGTALTFNATASDRDGAANIVSVDYFNTTAFQPDFGEPGTLGRDATAPYSFTWTATAGTAHIKAQIQDIMGYSGFSNVLTLNILNPGEWVMYPVADAYTANGRWVNTNYGTAATLTARTSATDGSTSESHLYFRIDSLPVIAHATLRVYGNVLGGTGDVVVAAAAVDSVGWLENGTVGLRKGITWTLRPPIGTRIGVKTVSGAMAQWYEFDVTAHVKAKKAAGATMAGFVLQGVDVTTSYASFASRSAAGGKPELILSNR